MLRSNRSSVVLFLCVPLLLALAGTASGTPSGDAVALADGVVVDAQRQVAYVMRPARGIDAVELGSGDVRWSADIAAKPLLAVGDVLIAQGEAREAGRLEIVSLDARTGIPGKLAAQVDLPDGLMAQLHDTPLGSFRVQAYKTGNQVTLSWQASTTGDAAQGYLPSSEESMVPSIDGSQQAQQVAPVQKAAKVQRGAVALDLASGSVGLATKSAAAPRSLDILQQKMAGLEGQQYVSADGRHVLASVRDATASVWEGYRWQIYTRDGGKRLGSFAHSASAAPFVVADRSLVFVSQPYFKRQDDDIVAVPMKLRAIDLMSGTEVWTTEVDDSAFRGSYAP